MLKCLLFVQWMAPKCSSSEEIFVIFHHILSSPIVVSKQGGLPHIGQKSYSPKNKSQLTFGEIIKPPVAV